MKFLALVSGGKDSFFNLHHCLSQGHELVALGNLHPENPQQDDIDSFMFQTVGHDIIDYYGKCLDVPLYRQAIEGGSTNQKLEYSKTENDEIEDLYKLIRTIISHHPDIEAVSCGAILSHYQRTRVENICDRFALTSLTFLWQSDQDSLLKSMCDSELDARIIKVAAMGLTSKHLTKSITELYPYLVKLNKMYDVHICGEGGEFETMVLDCCFFKKKLQIVDYAVVELPGDVSYAKLKVELVDKPETDFLPVVAPPLLETKFQELGSELDLHERTVVEDYEAQISHRPAPVISIVGNNLYVGNLTASAGSMSQEIWRIFSELQNYLEDYELTFNDIQHVTLLVSDMGGFGEVNKCYEEEFKGLYLPPSRICVETALPEGQFCSLSCKCILKETYDKKGIHIRSRSYWAPQNIGPYSQARVEEQMTLSLATISGQIPLVPSSMELASDETESILLTIQHFERIKKLINVQEISLALCFITSKVDVKTFCQIWDSYCDMERGDCHKRLIILKVKCLPKNAIIEIGGETYRQVEDFEEEEEFAAKLEQNKVVQKVQADFPGTVLTHLKNQVQLLVFSDGDIESLLKVNNGHVRVYCNGEAFESIRRHKFEYMPTLNVLDSEMTEHKYAVVITLEI